MCAVFCSAQFRTQNRCALLLELLCLLFCAIPDTKPLRTFAGICAVFCSAQFRTQNRCALLLELLCLLFCAIPD
ncbi:hypothetical protein GR241_06680, partial [Rhizobium leguminosarum]|nr:hypothetical protein [Rhizobium ruizarguesonis]